MDWRLGLEHDSLLPSRDPWKRGEQPSWLVQLVSILLTSRSCRCSARYFEAEHLSLSLEVPRVRSSKAEPAERA